MQFDSGLPEWWHPGALGYSMPYAQTGTRIHVLVDRLHVPVSKPLGGALLGMCWRTNWRTSWKDSRTTRKRAS